MIFPPRRSLYELVRNPFAGTGAMSLLGGLLSGRDVRALGQIAAPLHLFNTGEPLALMPNVFLR